MIFALQIISILALIAGLAGTYVYQSVPGIPWVCGSVAGVALVAYLWLDRKNVKATMTHRSTLHGLNAAFKAVLFIAIAVVINMIFVNYEWKYDATKNKAHTLSEQSIKVVKDLKTPVIFRAFVNPQTMGEYKEIFDRYRYGSDKVKVEFMDVMKDPLVAKTYNVTQLDTILVESDARTARIEGLANGPLDPKMEEKITNAIIQTSKGGKKKAYFLAGHGERSISQPGQGSFSEIKGILQEGRYDVAELKLVSSEKIPLDTEILVVAGPKSEFFPHELGAIEEYLTQRAGHVLMLLEPDSPASLQPWLAKFGIDWKPKRIVVELNALRRAGNYGPVVPFIENYSKTHVITKDARMPTVLQVATPMQKMEKIPEGYKVEDLFSTSEASFDVAFAGKEIKIDEKKDKRGPLNVAFAVEGKSAKALDAQKDSHKDAQKKDGEEEKAPEFKMVVIGDADFASNTIRSFGMNSDLFMNTLSWLANEESLIAIRPRDANDAKMVLTESNFRVVQLASMIFAPLGLFAMAIGVWVLRRRK